MDDKQKSRKYFDSHSSTFLNRNGYWNYDYRLTSRILMDNGTVVINELTSPKLLRRFMNWCFTKWPTGDHAVYSRAEMEQMLRTAGFQNIRSRMITPFSYVSVGRKKEEKPAMIKLAGLSDEQVMGNATTGFSGIKTRMSDQNK